MKILIFLSLFVFCVVAHNSDSTESEESSSSEEIIYESSKPVNRKVEDPVSSESSSSSSSEEIIHTRAGDKSVSSESSSSSSSEEIIHTRAKGQKQQHGHNHHGHKLKHRKKNQYKRPDHDIRWTKYKIQYKLKYSSERKEKRAKQRFVKNRLKVWKHKDTNQNSSVRIDVNKFAICTKREFKQRLGFKPEMSPELRSYFSPSMTRQSVPDSYDSRQIPGAVTLVRDQGDCGGCWAFATAATLETVFYLKYRKPYMFSEQHLIDCDGFNDGCDGGTYNAAFQYIKRYDGINALKLYPYEDGRKRCRADPSFNRPVFISDVKGFPNTHNSKLTAAEIEDMMKVGCATYGAVACAIDAEHTMFYSGGVFSGPCSIGPNHAVTIVGYGTCEETGLDYWIIKNSWGPDWGERGYLRLKRGTNACGVTHMASIPIIADNIDFTRLSAEDQMGD